MHTLVDSMPPPYYPYVASFTCIFLRGSLGAVILLMLWNCGIFIKPKGGDIISSRK